MNQGNGPTDKELLEAMVQVLRPLARKYTACTTAQQQNLSDWVPVRMDHLRDAYLMIYKYEQTLSKRR